MINLIIGILTMILVAFLFGKIRGFIFNRTKKKILTNLTNTWEKTEWDISKTNLKASIGNTYKKNGNEVFKWSKFRKIFYLGSLVEWIKSIKEIIDLRKLIIYLVILSSIFAYGYFKGRGNTPIKVNLDYKKEFKMKLNGHYLIKPKNSQNLRVEDLKGNIIKHIKVKDFPLLAKKLKPIGFILEPIAVVGYGAGTVGGGVEGGAGVSFIKYWKWKLDVFLTNKGIYLGTTYQITSNSGLGLGVGKGFKGDNRIILYYKFQF